MTEQIEVENGKILRMEFTYFAVQICRSDYSCQCDYVRITDGDGTTLMDNSCGYSSRDPSYSYYFLPPTITSRSNRVDVLFHTYDDNDYGSRSGWNLSWVAMTPGECQQHPAPRMQYSSIVKTIFIKNDDC